MRHDGLNNSTNNDDDVADAETDGLHCTDKEQKDDDDDHNSSNNKKNTS